MKCDTLAPLLEAAWKAEVDKCNANRMRKTRNSASTAYKANGEKTYFSEKSPIISGQSTRQEHEKSTKPNLFLALLRVFWWDWTEATFYRTIAEVLWLLEPIALRFIITIAEDKSSAPEWEGYFFCCMLFVNLCISSCFYHMSYHHIQAVGLKVKTALMCLIYKKALTMKRSGTQASTIGEIVNLMSVDCQRIQDSLTFSFYAFVTLFTFGIALAQLWTLMAEYSATLHSGHPS
ncbi:multidrug resistance-associated protein 1-like [Mercenaria mercenaria]|uniref:multidrug resistance-associated protein 1-like n=1 Tax=Mercenaria mercenaria TaxID=6596 RepID=UPI00234E9CFC|nr:multidrug resistance-associated protein 1-like [Mercenaria mercenaria]